MRINLIGIDNSVIEMKKVNQTWFKLNTCTNKWIINNCSVCEEKANNLSNQPTSTLKGN